MELEQLQARFPGDNCNLLARSKEKIAYLIKFQPADQDWVSIILSSVILPSIEDFGSHYFPYLNVKGEGGN